MKKIVLSGLIASTMACNIGNPVYHIKAKQWYKCKWQVVFTNGGFNDEETLNRTWMWDSQDEAVHQLIIFSNETEAVRFASNFKTYAQCRAFNDSVKQAYDSMLVIVNRHIIPVKPIPAKEEDCESIKGKEVLVY